MRKGERDYGREGKRSGSSYHLSANGMRTVSLPGYHFYVISSGCLQQREFRCRLLPASPRPSLHRKSTLCSPDSSPSPRALMTYESCVISGSELVPKKDVDERRWRSDEPQRQAATTKFRALLIMSSGRWWAEKCSVWYGQTRQKQRAMSERTRFTLHTKNLDHF